MAKKNKNKRSSARDRVKAAASAAGPGGGGGTMFQNIPQDVEYFNPEKGTILMRIIPYVVSDKKHPDGDIAPEGEIWYKRPFKRYRQIGIEKKPYISPLSVGKPDPIFEYFKEAKADPSVPDKEANKAKAQDCVIYNLQWKKVKDKKWSDPMVFWFSFHNFEKQLKKELNDPDNEDYLAFMDPEGGYDLKVRWEQDSFEGNKFLLADRITFLERDEDLDEELIENAVDLDTVLVIKGHKELQNIFLEIDDDGDEDEPEDEPAPARKKKVAKKDEPEDEPDPDDETLSIDELMGMSEKKMKKFVKKNDLEDEVDLDGDEDEIRAELAEHLDLEIPEDEAAEEPGECPVCGEPLDEDGDCTECDWEDGDDVPDPEEDNAGHDWDSLSDMGLKGLKALNKDEELGIKVKKLDEDELREAIAKKLDIDIPEADDPEDDDPEDDDPEDEDDAGDGECPSGHKFGTDCDEHDECDECPKWEECMEAQEG